MTTALAPAATESADHAAAVPGGASFIAQAACYLAVGSSAMVLYLGAYAALALAVPAVAANVLAWTLSTIVGNSAHRKITFGVSGRDSAAADAAIGMATSVLGLLLSTAAVTVASSASSAMQVVALLAGSSIGGASRFLAMRWWLGRGARAGIAAA